MPKHQRMAALFSPEFFEEKNRFLREHELQTPAHGYVESLKSEAQARWHDVFNECEVVLANVRLKKQVEEGLHLPGTETIEDVEFNYDCRDDLLQLCNAMINYRLAERFFGGPKAGTMFPNDTSAKQHAFQALEWMKFRVKIMALAPPAPSTFPDSPSRHASQSMTVVGPGAGGGGLAALADVALEAGPKKKKNKRRKKKASTDPSARAAVSAATDEELLEQATREALAQKRKIKEEISAEFEAFVTQSELKCLDTLTAIFFRKSELEKPGNDGERRGFKEPQSVVTHVVFEQMRKLYEALVESLFEKGGFSLTEYCKDHGLTELEPDNMVTFSYDREGWFTTILNGQTIVNEWPNRCDDLFAHVNFDDYLRGVIEDNAEQNINESVLCQLLMRLHPSVSSETTWESASAQMKWNTIFWCTAAVTDVVKMSGTLAGDTHQTTHFAVLFYLEFVLNRMFAILSADEELVTYIKTNGLPMRKTDDMRQWINFKFIHQSLEHSGCNVGRFFFSLLMGQHPENVVETPDFDPFGREISVDNTKTVLAAMTKFSGRVNMNARKETDV